MLSDYDAGWPRAFEAERARITQALRPGLLAGLEHIGSTAIPGMSAKPILDLLALVVDLAEAPACYSPLQALGYQYHPELEAELPERRYFCKCDPARPGRQTYHLHLVQERSDFHVRHLLFRDHLREHPEDAARYQALKRRLAARFAHDRAAYTEGKSSFVREIEARARGQR